MNQKTIKITSDAAYYALHQELSDIKPGDEYILIEKRNVNTGLEWFELIRHTGEGVPGNLNSALTRYHGWRGTTNNVARYAHGVRKVIKVSDIENDGTDDYIKVTVGKDLHPDWE